MNIHEERPEKSLAYRDGYEAAAETQGSAGNPFAPLCENGDEEACRNAENWELGAATALADIRAMADLPDGEPVPLPYVSDRLSKHPDHEDPEWPEG